VRSVVLQQTFLCEPDLDIRECASFSEFIELGQISYETGSCSRRGALLVDNRYLGDQRGDANGVYPAGATGPRQCSRPFTLVSTHKSR
jgi:hypothetical protein